MDYSGIWQFLVWDNLRKLYPGFFAHKELYPAYIAHPCSPRPTTRESVLRGRCVGETVHVVSLLRWPQSRQHLLLMRDSLIQSRDVRLVMSRDWPKVCDSENFDIVFSWVMVPLHSLIFHAFVLFLGVDMSVILCEFFYTFSSETEKNINDNFIYPSYSDINSMSPP